MIPHNRPTLGAPEAQAAARAIASGYLSANEEVRRFEDELCAQLGLPPGHAAACSSGSAALFLALWVLDARDRRVAFPAYACAAVRHAVGMARGLEVPIDIAPQGPNIDLDAAAASGAEIVIAPHLYGIPQRLPANERMIEDCAQALGASVDGRPVGASGACSIFSFGATKLITTGGQGGAVASRDAALIAQIRDYLQFDQRPDRKLRFNLQLTDLGAAVGRAQLARFAEFAARREAIFQRYREHGFTMLDAGAGMQAVRYRAVARIADPRGAIDRLAKAEIGAIVPIEEWEILDDPERHPNAQALARSTISLPIYPSLRDDEVDRIAAALGTPVA